MRKEAGRLREEWAATAGRELPIDPEAVFPEGGGFFERRAAAERARLLARLRPTLLRALEPGERIRYAARGIDRRVAAAGYLFQLASQVAIVLTDRRLLLVQVNRSGQARDVKNQVRLAEVRGARSGLLAGFEIRLADGKKLRYISVPRRSRAALAAALPKLDRSDAPSRSATPSVEHLCPACLQLVPGRAGATPICPNPACRIPFRDPARAIRLSLLVPGLGDLYLRQHLLGAMEFAVSMVLLALAVSFVLEAAAIGLGDTEAVGLLVGAVLLVGLPRAVSFSLTRHMARSGLVPLAERPTPQALRNLPAFPPWAYALFLAGAVGLAAGVVAGEKAARPQGKAAAARRAARDGAFDEAVARWREAEAAGASDNARARMAVALYRAGDLEDGDRVGAPLAGRQIEKALADEFNGFLRHRDAAMKDYGAGLAALAKGDRANAGPALGRALAFFRNVKRPDLPKTHGEAALHLAAAFLAPPVNEHELAAAERLQAEAGADAPTPKRLVTLAALHSLRGEREHASATLAKLDLAALSPSWRLLALEARLRLASSDTDRKAIAEEAKAIQADQLGDGQQERLGALQGGGLR